jgi:2-polyprenyl-3-methyl-5-hydroxy-6-metoxy-1,4-benzoquinol methylase
MMDTNTRQTTSGFFDGYARKFDAIYGNADTKLNAIVNKYLRRSMKLRYDRTLEGCAPIEGKRVLDVGCGPGHYAVALAERGAAHVFGLDFAQGMIDIAKDHAERAGVAARCDFALGDFLTYPLEGPFDYTVLMGFMDYMKEPRRVIDRAISLTRGKAFFSFPADGGLLAWQRKIRYRRRCELFMYGREQLHALFDDLPRARVTYETLARDYFVTVNVA